MGACIGANITLVSGGIEGVLGCATGMDWISLAVYATALIAAHWLLAAGMAALFFVMPVAVYVAIVKDQA